MPTLTPDELKIHRAMLKVKGITEFKIVRIGRQVRVFYTLPGDQPRYGFQQWLEGNKTSEVLTAIEALAKALKGTKTPNGASVDTGANSS